MNRGCDRVMLTLADEGVSDIFALSGNQIMPLFDASLDAGIRLYHTRHEAAAVYMAEGYAQSSGGLGVALVTAGAGLANAVGPLLTARASDTPLLLLSGDSPVARDGQGAFQEMDQVAITQAVTKWSVRVGDADTLSSTIRQAVAVACAGRPGPVHVSLPADVLLATTAAVSARQEPETQPVEVQSLHDWLAPAQRPILVLGAALNQSRQPGLAKDLEAATGAPVVVMESPRGPNDPSLGALALVFRDADRVVLLGKPLDFTLQFGDVAPAAHWAVVNQDPEELARAQRNRGPQVTLTSNNNPTVLARALAAHGTRLDCHDWRAKVKNACSQRVTPDASQEAIHPAGLCEVVQRALDQLDDPVLVCDGGEFGQWAQAGLNARRRIINGVSGAIGGGLCYAMGARALDPDATVIALMGDGTLGFHLAEFETAVREDLPFVAIVGNDHCWNAEHQIQIREFGAGRLHGCALSGARYDEAVAALGGFGALVSDLAELPEALSRAIASGKPACINVMIRGTPSPTISGL